MPKSDFLIQLAVFSLSAATIALLFIKLYPEQTVKHLKPKTQPPASSAQTTPSDTPQIQKIPPSQISIDSLGLNLAVSPGIIVNNKWTLYDDKVSWLSTSETPGFGNVIIYGHDRPGIFASLTKLVVGDEIKIRSGDKTYVYQVTEKRKVLPEEVDAIISDRERLTLYTCDGSYDEKRLIVIAYPKDKR